MKRYFIYTTVMNIFCLLLCHSLMAQTETVPTELVDTQRQLADRFQRLELLAGRLAELSRSTQPRRARLLHELIAKSRERDIEGRFEGIISDLQKDSLGKALTSQKQLQKDLQRLLELLLQEDRDRQIESQRKRIGKYLEELKKLIRLQRGIKARTEGGDLNEKTAKDQDRAAESVGKLKKNIEKTEGLDQSNQPQQEHRAR